MNKKIRFMSLQIVTAIFIALLSSNIQANTVIDGVEKIVSLHEYNEYSYISELMTTETVGLTDIGITETNAVAMYNSFFVTLQERALLSEKELISMGYDDAEIEIFRKYALGNSLTENELMAISGTCSGSLMLISCTNNQAEFRYYWAWDHKPIFAWGDSAAIRWMAYDSNGYDLNVIKTNAESNIKYYDGNTFINNASGTFETGLDFNSVNLQFDMSITYTTPTTIQSIKYAKSGNIDVTVALAQGVNNAINHIMVAGAYGHSTLSLDFPSISYSPPDSISIDFSPNATVEMIAIRQAVIYPTPRIEYID